MVSASFIKASVFAHAFQLRCALLTRTGERSREFIFFNRLRASEMKATFLLVLTFVHCSTDPNFCKHTQGSRREIEQQMTHDSTISGSMTSDWLLIIRCADIFFVNRTGCAPQFAEQKSLEERPTPERIRKTAVTLAQRTAAEARSVT